MEFNLWYSKHLKYDILSGTSLDDDAAVLFVFFISVNQLICGVSLVNKLLVYSINKFQVKSYKPGQDFSKGFSSEGIGLCKNKNPGEK